MCWTILLACLSMHHVCAGPGVGAEQGIGSFGSSVLSVGNHSERRALLRANKPSAEAFLGPRFLFLFLFPLYQNVIFRNGQNL